jgi:hypothetical protein
MIDSCLDKVSLFSENWFCDGGKQQVQKAFDDC